MPTGNDEEWRVTKAKASGFLDRIQQGMTNNVNTHVCLRELEDVVARLGEDPQDLIACIKTLMDLCEMINDEHCEHKLHCHIIRAYCHEGKLLGKLMAKPFKTPSSELADITVNHFAIQHAQEQICHSPKPVDAICHDRHRAAHSSHNGNGHTPLAPSKETSSIAHNNTQLEEQTALHGTPIAPNATRLDTGDQNAIVASHLKQGMHLQLGHSREGPDAHLRATTPVLVGVTKQMTMDVGEDHSPQDEIAFHGIQPNVTTVATACATGNTKGTPAHDELFINAINYGTVGNTHPKEIMVGDVHTPWCNKAYTTVQLPASASRKGTASLCIKVDTSAGGNVLPLVYFDIFIQTRLDQLACQLAWITSAPDPPPITNPIYPYMVHSVPPSLGGKTTLVLYPTG